LGTTSRCPSLVRECPGPQKSDGNNDVAWMPLGGCCTLGVTWYSTSAKETDMALNTNFNWNPAQGGYDARLVFLHENGHVAGLGHSSDQNAVMYAYYNWQGELQQDDIDGISALYPASGGTGTGGATSTPSPTPTATPTATATPAPANSASVSVGYGTNGGKNQDRHLNLTVTASDGGTAVSGAAVEMELRWKQNSTDNYAFYSFFTGTTDGNGTVTFTANNAPSGFYMTEGNLTNMTLVGWQDPTYEKP
ncbi:MAG TPA: matrixin family metalloprotease, partial [Anaerolineae bacterium]|nr:matrixin family metalloprotease [Anaerolineae bacterium]